VRSEIRHRMAEDSDLDARELTAVAAELQRRLKRTGLALPPRTRSRHDKRPRTRAIPVIRRDSSEAELLIVRAISRTAGAAQFGCAPDGSVFTADTDGWSMPSGRRDDVTGLSTLLDDAAGIFNDWKRNGIGGRFYERNGAFFDADDGAVFLEVVVREDVGLRSENVLLQRLRGWVGRFLE
jgi:hypothetical protein